MKWFVRFNQCGVYAKRGLSERGLSKVREGILRIEHTVSSALNH